MRLFLSSFTKTGGDFTVTLEVSPEGDINMLEKKSNLSESDIH